jgi:anion-transporting  ArsA/GET3 family ATPase
VTRLSATIRRSAREKRSKPQQSAIKILDQLLARRAIIVLGKGGVGRTSVCAALAAIAAGRGMHTLVMETDVRTPIAAAHGMKSGFRPVRLGANLFGMLLDRQASVEEYLGFVVARPLLRAVFASSLYQYFIHAAPALRELLMMGKVYHEIERRPSSLPRWDLILVDMPASGQALAMLGMPSVACATFGDHHVGREAREVADFFHDRARCAMLAVTSVEQLALVEVLEILHKLAELGLATEAIVFNRMSRAGFEAADLARLTDFIAASSGAGQLDDLCAIARAELNRRTRERRAIAMLKRTIGAPIVQLPECAGATGLTLFERLSTAFAAT